MRIKYWTGQEEREFVPTTDFVIIGRELAGECVLDLSHDNNISRRHARITFKDGQLWLEDLQSKNGTFLNGTLVERKTVFRPQDEIQVGQTTIKVLPQPTDGQADLGPAASETAFMARIADAAPTGHITERMDAAQGTTSMEVPTGDLLPEALQTTKRQLEVFLELADALGGLTALGPLLEVLLQHLMRAVPSCRSAGVLLLEGDDLNIRAFWPENMDITVSRSLAWRAIEGRESFIWNMMFDDKIDPTMSIIQHETQSAIYTPLAWKDEALGVIYIDKTKGIVGFSQSDLRLMTALASQASVFVKNQAFQEQIWQEEMVKRNLLRQFSPKVAERLTRHQAELKLGGERAWPVTLLFTDVRGFTVKSASMNPDDVVRLLNEMYSLLIPIIFNYGGTVDKYTGDGVLAVFGSPEPDDYQWENAIQAAIDMQLAMQSFEGIWEVGIGIHTGEVVHGFVGTPERMEYTVIGDAVNRAARVTDGAWGGEVVLSREVYEQVANLVEVEMPPRLLQTKHPEREPDIEVYVVQGIVENP